MPFGSADRDVPLSLRAAVYAGVAAGVVSTIAQVALWVLFTDAFPAILFRDTRHAAAIVLGSRALGESLRDPTIAIAATLIHFGLSIAYGIVIGAAVRNMRGVAALLTGLALGAAIYAVNMYGFTAAFPWFVANRDAITLAAHMVFGIVAACVYRRVASHARVP